MLPEQIGGVLIGPLISAVIQALKAAGMPVQYADIVNIVLSTLASLAFYVIGVYPEVETYIGAGLQILTTILTAAGFYAFGIKRFTS